MADEATLLHSDKKYRQYLTEVERALRAFEYTSEWADLIAALGRLNKVLTQNNKYQVSWLSPQGERRERMYNYNLAGGIIMPMFSANTVQLSGSIII